MPDAPAPEPAPEPAPGRRPGRHAAPRPADEPSTTASRVALPERVSEQAGAGGLLRPVSAGVVSALVGFTSSFVVVLAGLAAVGASPDQASSGLLVLSVTMGACCVLLAAWTRMPVTVAWSTPGAALLVTTGVVDGGWPAAVGAFVVTGVLVVLTGLVRPLGALVSSVPTAVAQAMLAGVLFSLCLGAATGLAESPLAVAPVVVVWVLALRLAPRWASPLALLAAAVVVAVSVARSGEAPGVAELVPRLELTAPVFTVAGLLGIALPLWVVTMASQNVPGVAVMRGLGWAVPWRRSMVVTGAATVLAAPGGGHAVNLAAISAALAAGPDAGEDRSRRWVASVTVGLVYALLGVASGAFGALVLLAPPGVVAAVAGLALLGTLASALQAALADPAERVAAAVAFVTAASGVVVLGVGAAFWALVAGIVVRAALLGRRRA